MGQSPPMLSKIFLGMSLVGSEWVLYLLVLLSVVSIALILERWFFYRTASRGLGEFRLAVRDAVEKRDWEKGSRVASERVGSAPDSPDLEASLARTLLSSASKTGGKPEPEILGELAQDAVLGAKLRWEKNLALLATIGSNAPFVGLFGTVLGIIKAFHDLSQQSNAGAQTVSAGISEALVATAIGILVAIPAVVAFNLFQRRVRAAVTEAEALKSFLIGKLAEH